MSTREERQAVREKILGGLRARTPEVNEQYQAELTPVGS